MIEIRGARQNNLKGIDLDLPKGKLIVFTGVSGSGKSSLAFDTLYAEGQRRYIESMALRSRILMKQLPRPDVDLIQGLSPTLAVGQQLKSLSRRNSIGTQTDLYDLLALLFARIGVQHSPTTGEPLQRQTEQEIVEAILSDYAEGDRIRLLAPVDERHQDELTKRGFLRLRADGQEVDLSEEAIPDGAKEVQVVVDRLAIRDGVRERLAESVHLALDVGQGVLQVQEGRDGPCRYYTETFVCPATGESFPPLTLGDFNFNSIQGACPTCHGWGGQERVDVEEIEWDVESPFAEQIRDFLYRLPRKERLVYLDLFDALEFDEEALPKEVPQETLQELFFGSDRSIQVAAELGTVTTKWKGLVSILDEDLRTGRERSRLSGLEWVGWQECSTCNGAGLKGQSLASKLEGKNIAELCALTVDELMNEISEWQLDHPVAEELLPRLTSRLECMRDLGLGYLALNRRGDTLSVGEAQRVQLAAQIGAELSGVLYVLDEPSRGLHRKNIGALATVFKRLRDLGNTVLLVEHDRTLIEAADHVVELGPGAGSHGGEVVFQGSVAKLRKSKTETGRWLGGETLPKHTPRPLSDQVIEVRNANLHNLKNINCEIPLKRLIGFCGVSGAGKSSLVIDFLAEKLRHEATHKLVVVDQSSGGGSSRSLPATYIGVMNPLRRLFAATKLAKARGYTASSFSLSRKGVRCEACEGLGNVRMKMDFLPDVWVPCDVCNGRRFNFEALQVEWKGHTFADVLQLSVEEALELFQNQPEIASRLELMAELGLEYLKLGQPFSTLSGGEVQRLRLVTDLAKKASEPTLYILDEPSAGLHLSDVAKLVKIFHRLVEQGHSVWVIEHHPEILNQCDWLLELGPEGGPQGGHLLYAGAPHQTS